MNNIQIEENFCKWCNRELAREDLPCSSIEERPELRTNQSMFFNQIWATATDSKCRDELLKRRKIDTDVSQSLVIKIGVSE